ncbi:hypothetical protein PIROE2DRAFT_2222 [Piromyces sp. E2]|nr:hypothetical protein PIROE2DRAFT_2222 [Piromyces sp. E2]|eukprot:OUM69798.1 hypothetical protein PIROE2DRAFT_2222 [Piromyces sp. E2]
MKFTTPIYALIATSTVLAYPQTGQNGMEGIPKDCDVNFFKNNIDCLPADDRNAPSFRKFNNKVLKSAEEYCSLYKTEKCKNFYTNLMPNASKCGMLEEGKTEDFEQGLKFLDIVCTTDENNKICPIFTEAVQKNETEAINSVCKSKICTESFLKLFEIVYGPEKLSSTKGQVFNKDYVYDENDKNGDIAVAFLQSDYCTAQHVGATNTNNANAPNTANTANTANAPNTANVANNGNAQNSTVTGQQNAQSSGASTMKYSVFGTLLAMAYALL